MSSYPPLPYVPPFYPKPVSSPCPALNTVKKDTSGQILSVAFTYGDIPPASFYNINGIYSQRFVQPVQQTFIHICGALMIRRAIRSISRLRTRP